MWAQPNLAWLLSMVAGGLLLMIVVVGFLSWHLSGPFVFGNSPSLDPTDPTI
jgi:hypothetical protein